MEAFQMGQQLGAGNNPLTSLGQAIKGTLETYKGHLAAQAAANLQGSKNQNDLDVAKIGAGYGLDGSAPLPDSPPKLETIEGPDGMTLYSTTKTEKGRTKHSDWAYAPRDKSIEQQLKDERARGKLLREKNRADARIKAEEDRMKQGGGSALEQGIGKSVVGTTPQIKQTPHGNFQKADDGKWYPVR